MPVVLLIGAGLVAAFLYLRKPAGVLGATAEGIALQAQQQEALRKQEAARVAAQKAQDENALAARQGALTTLAAADAAAQAERVAFQKVQDAALQKARDTELARQAAATRAAQAAQDAATAAKAKSAIVTQSDDWTQVPFCLRTSLSPPRYGGLFDSLGPDKLTAMYAAGYRFDARGSVLKPDGSFYGGV